MADYTSFGAFGIALDNAYKGLDKGIELALKDNVDSIISKIKLRVSGSGVKADGGMFSTPYSRSHEYRRKKKGKGSLGTQTSYKGFYYQGTMWDNFKMLVIKNQSTKITASLGFEGSNLYKSNEELNEIHSKREGIKIAAPNNDEAVEFTKKIGFAIGEYLKNAL